MGFTNFMKKVAPWITTAASIAAPGAAPLIALAAKTLSGGLNTTVDPTPESISEALATAAATPDQLATLKKLDNDFALQMKTLDIQNIDQLAQIAEQDTASARAREMAVKDATPKILAYGIVLLACLVSLIILAGKSPAMKDVTQATMVGVVIGYIFSEVKQVYAYYFGSSAGSAEKTQLLAQAPPIQK